MASGENTRRPKGGLPSFGFVLLLFFPLSTVLEIVRVHIYPRQINFSCHTLLEITFSPQLHFVILAGIFERRMFRGA